MRAYWNIKGWSQKHTSFVDRAYSRPILLSTINTPNTAPFCENYRKLYFDAKHLKKGGEIFGALFILKKCPSWRISNAALNF